MKKNKKKRNINYFLNNIYKYKYPFIIYYTYLKKLI